ncbi:hypothetical protein [Bradyrhizobium yuanmingense]|uniref:hypothetical protein n=1 Tax=Bradyrhizobium yuanmingense TaxID=108015 RepID=UPI0012FE5521|nr:hypothetical protein [Bradyrhizobium yuanmingense]
MLSIERQFGSAAKADAAAPNTDARKSAAFHVPVLAIVSADRPFYFIPDREDLPAHVPKGG